MSLCKDLNRFEHYISERKSLEKLDTLNYQSDITINSFTVPLAKGTANTMYVCMNNLASYVGANFAY